MNAIEKEKLVPPNLTHNFAHGSYQVFVVFGKISVKQKHDRAHATFLLLEAFYGIQYLVYEVDQIE